jgi:ribonucleoside-triphosphate reductase
MGERIRVPKIKKRDGRIVDFEPKKISTAILKALSSVEEEDEKLAETLSKEVTRIAGEKFQDEIPTVENIQDIVEKVLIENRHAEAAKAYILYRQEVFWCRG